MIHLKGSPFQNTAAFLAAATEIAEYYGFEYFQDIARQKNAIPSLPPGAKADTEILFARRDERTMLSAARRLAQSSGGGSAILAWRTTALPSGAGMAFELHAAGIPTSIAEAILLAAADAIAKEAGVQNRSLVLNNLGGAESSARFVRDVGGYLRKHIDSIATSLRPRTVSDPLGTLIQLIERGHPGVARAPQSMDYLTEDERRRFWDFLEYVEMLGLPYELSGQILGSRDCWSHALFEIMGEDQGGGNRRSIASGGRYDPLMSRMARRPLSGAMVAIHVETRGSSTLRRKHRGVRSVYFAHLGPEARRRALPLLESLRQSGIPVYHNLWHERIGEQMTAAANLATPYVLVIGHKEAMENTVLVREVATNSQEAVPQVDLAGYLRRKHVGTPLKTV